MSMSEHEKLTRNQLQPLLSKETSLELERCEIEVSSYSHRSHPSLRYLLVQMPVFVVTTSALVVYAGIRVT